MTEFNSCADLVENKESLETFKKIYEACNDPLQEMLDMQLFLQEKLVEKLPKHNINPKDIKTKGELVSWIDRNFDSIMDEYRELKTSIGGMSNGAKAASSVWKRWKANHNTMINENLNDMSASDKLELRFEMIDIMHFIFNMLLGLGMTSKDIFILYMLKNEENMNRYNNRY